MGLPERRLPVAPADLACHGLPQEGRTSGGSGEEHSEEESSEEQEGEEQTPDTAAAVGAETHRSAERGEHAENEMEMDAEAQLDAAMAEVQEHFQDEVADAERERRPPVPQKGSDDGVFVLVDLAGTETGKYPAALAWVELIDSEEVHVRWYGYVNMNGTRIKQSSTITFEKYWSMQPGAKLDKALGVTRTNRVPTQAKVAEFWSSDVYSLSDSVFLPFSIPRPTGWSAHDVWTKDKVKLDTPFLLERVAAHYP